MIENRISKGARILGRTGAFAVGAVLAACSASNDGPYAAASDTSPVVGALTNSTAAATRDPRFEPWHRTMSETAPPHDGCFHAEYPSTTWIEEACGAAPERHVPSEGPLRPKTVGATGDGTISPDIVGDGTDWFAKSSGTITQATGSFPGVIGATSPNAYSLQLNSNAFTLPAGSALCNGGSSCSAAQQAVYSSSVAQTGAWFEYVVFGAAKCPSGFSVPSSGSAPSSGCYKPSASIPKVPLVPISDLASMQIELKSSATSDVFTMTIEGKAYVQSFPSVLGLGDGGWNSAEFGLYGDLGGSKATVSSNTTLITQLVTEPASNTVTCSSSQNVFTVESNTLNLVSGCCTQVAQGTSPGIQFEETNVSKPTCNASTLVASPSSLSVQIGGVNTASTNLVAGGWWEPGGIPPQLSVADLPAGVTWSETNYVTPTIQFTAGSGASPGTYVIPVTGTMYGVTVVTDVTLTIGEHCACGETVFDGHLICDVCRVP